MSDVLQRPFWTGQPIKQALAFRVHKTIAGRERDAIAELWTHAFGWELRLLVDGEFQRSQVCRREGEVFATIDEWRGALKAKGWTPPRLKSSE